MKIVKLFLPGKFEDAFVYMGRLLILTEDRALQIYSLDEIVQYLEEKIPAALPVPTLMFSRNDWLVSSLFGSLVKNRGTFEAILATFDSFPEPYFVLDEPRLILKEEQLRVSANVILDINIYNGRLYMGADTGFYHIDIQWDQSDTIVAEKVEKRHDARCLNTSAKSGAVNASCGDAGLFTAIDDFQWFYRNKRHAEMTRLADKSLKTAWFNFDLMNYPTHITPFLLRSERRNISAQSGFDREPQVLTELGKNRVYLDDLFGMMQDKYDFQPEMVQFTYNTNNVLFIHTTTGNFYSAGMYLRDNVLNVRFTKTYKGANSRILSAHPCRVGTVIETDDRVWLFAHGKWILLFDTAVLSVRTFTRSRRFQNLVALTSEEGLFLIGLFDDTEIVAPGDGDNGRQH